MVENTLKSDQGISHDVFKDPEQVEGEVEENEEVQEGEEGVEKKVAS